MINHFWKRITLIGVKEDLPLDMIRKITNTNRFIFFTSLIGVVNFFLDFKIGLYFYGSLDLIVSCLLLSLLLINYFGFYKLSTNFFIFFLNIVVFVLASSGGRETGNFLFFFPLMIISFFMIGIKEKKVLIFYITLPIGLLIISIMTNYSLFQYRELESEEIKFLFWRTMGNLIIFAAYGLYNIVDINARIEASLLEERANLDAIFSNSLLNIVLLDSEMKVKTANKLAKDALHNMYGREIHIGDNISEFISKKDIKSFVHSFQAALSGTVIQLEKKLGLQGQYQWYEIHFCPTYDEKKDINGVIFSTIEITERKKSEINIKLGRTKAEAANIAKSHFLSAMSHEIRTPMNAVIGMTGILLENNPRKDQIENLKILKFSAENLLIIINDILDFNRIDSGKIELEEVEFSLKHLVATISNFLSPLIHEKPINFNTIYDEAIPSVLTGDSVRLSQIITNLISNAIKFTDRGKITFEVHLEEVGDDYAYIGFSVTDTGIGISEDKIDYIFESFTQGYTDTFRKFGGTGLGLTITKRLLEFQNSTIFVESELGKGSKFYFSIKFKQSKIHNSGREFSYEIKPALYDSELLHGIKLLLVEDYAINQIVVSEFLSKWKINLDIADNGLQALEKIESKDYDIILMDLQMPEMDGCETTRRIRGMENTKSRNTPIIALTASAMSEIRDQVLEAGMNDYISKPFNPEDLFNKLLKYTNKKNHSA